MLSIRTMETIRIEIRNIVQEISMNVLIHCSIDNSWQYYKQSIGIRNKLNC